MKIRGRHEVVREPGRVPKLVGTPVTTLNIYGASVMLLSARRTPVPLLATSGMNIPLKIETAAQEERQQ